MTSCTPKPPPNCNRTTVPDEWSNPILQGLVPADGHFCTSGVPLKDMQVVNWFWAVPATRAMKLVTIGLESHGYRRVGDATGTDDYVGIAIYEDKRGKLAVSASRALPWDPMWKASSIVHLEYTPFGR